MEGRLTVETPAGGSASMQWKADRPLMMLEAPSAWDFGAKAGCTGRFQVTDPTNPHGWVLVVITRGGESRTLSVPIALASPRE